MNNRPLNRETAGEGIRGAQNQRSPGAPSIVDRDSIRAGQHRAERHGAVQYFNDAGRGGGVQSERSGGTRVDGLIKIHRRGIPKAQQPHGAGSVEGDGTRRGDIQGTEIGHGIRSSGDGAAGPVGGGAPGTAREIGPGAIGLGVDGGRDSQSQSGNVGNHGELEGAGRGFHEETEGGRMI